MMTSYDDPNWRELLGAHRKLYDPRPALRKLEAEGGSQSVWDELWQELHHQGDVDVASYAAVTVLAEIESKRRDLGWDGYAMVAVIESERHRITNPDVPEWLYDSYGMALHAMRRCAVDQLRTCADPLFVPAALSIIALTSGLWAHGTLLASYDEAELSEIVGEELAWSQLYEDKGPIE